MTPFVPLFLTSPACPSQPGITTSFGFLQGKRTTISTLSFKRASGLSNPRKSSGSQQTEPVVFYSCHDVRGAQMTSIETGGLGPAFANWTTHWSAHVTRSKDHALLRLANVPASRSWKHALTPSKTAPNVGCTRAVVDYTSPVVFAPLYQTSPATCRTVYVVVSKWKLSFVSLGISALRFLDSCCWFFSGDVRFSTVQNYLFDIF